MVRQKCSGIRRSYLDALNNKDISYAKDFFLYIETQLKIAKDFLDLEKKYQVLLQVKFFTHLLI
ncbi:hypothetical protein HXZ56_19390 [Escherichia coli]|uniref:hypothetical protein n=1 Tax=Escherichia coli TaxID=562 RepID=UPI0025773959|nr:hypothetical protein [Escherichia coli]MDM1102101.1 hypothetical protein [Escherichia coli]